MDVEASPHGERGWTFLTNHAHVLIALSRDPEARIRDLADLVGITDRAVQTILAELHTSGYVSKAKVGRRNQYRINPDLHFRHPAEASRSIGDLLRIFTAS